MNKKGDYIDVYVPVWNATMANISLLTLGGSAPEIFLCFFSTFIDIEAVPKNIGPMALIGSASFNVLVATGLAMVSVSEIKKVLSRQVFAVTVIFSLLAYVWLVIILVVNTPGLIDIEEAFMTLLWYPIMLLFVWLAEKCSPEGEGQESEEVINLRLAQKQELRALADQEGRNYVINIATGLKFSNKKEVQMIQSNFKDLIGVDDLNKVDVEELLAVLDADNPSA
jgi:Ca2+/Na+ antiporter